MVVVVMASAISALLQAGKICFGTIRAREKNVLARTVGRSRMMIATIPPQHAAPLFDHPVVRLVARDKRVQATDLLDRMKGDASMRGTRETASYQAFGVLLGGVARLSGQRIQDGG